MTATEVNGVQVIADENAASPLRNNGTFIPYRRVRKLLLADGSETYGCIDCDYTADMTIKIVSHMKKHTVAITPNILDMTLRDIITIIEKPIDDSDWKKRATDAERKLAALQGVIKGLFNND